MDPSSQVVAAVHHALGLAQTLGAHSAEARSLAASAEVVLQLCQAAAASDWGRRRRRSGGRGRVTPSPAARGRRRLQRPPRWLSTALSPRPTLPPAADGGCGGLDGLRAALDAVLKAGPTAARVRVSRG